MEMMLAMFSPLWALGLFLLLPFWIAVSLYIPFFLFGALINIKMMTSMKLPVKTGLEEMIGEEAWVIEDINPEGKVRVNGEIWAASASGRTFRKGEKGVILGARGLVLILGDPEDAEKRPGLSPINPGWLIVKTD
jgi:membrane-bound ClpP family serine protease